LGRRGHFMRKMLRKRKKVFRFWVKGDTFFVKC
jgi:hypothetical protein